MRILHRTNENEAGSSIDLWKTGAKLFNIECWSISTNDEEMLDTADGYDIVIVDKDLDKSMKLQHLLEGIALVVYHRGNNKKTMKEVSVHK
jgi:hypothetical protein